MMQKGRTKVQKEKGWNIDVKVLGGTFAIRTKLPHRLLPCRVSFQFHRRSPGAWLSVLATGLALAINAGSTPYTNPGGKTRL